MMKIERTAIERLRQGDILRDVEHIEHIIEEAGTIEISKIIFPLVIVLTQDCDLQYDAISRSPEDTNHRNQDKWLLSVLVAPLYNAEQVRRGEHLSELDWKMQPFQKSDTLRSFLTSNRIPRYHYLEFPDDLQIAASVIDFKHYFSANVKYLRELKEENFVCSVSDLFRERISQRFANFLARIGLPEIADV